MDIAELTNRLKLAFKKGPHSDSVLNSGNSDIPEQDTSRHVQVITNMGQQYREHPYHCQWFQTLDLFFYERAHSPVLMAPTVTVAFSEAIRMTVPKVDRSDLSAFSESGSAFMQAEHFEHLWDLAPHIIGRKCSISPCVQRFAN